MFLCLPITFVVLLVTLDQIVLCWGKNQNMWLDLSLGRLMFPNLFLSITFGVFQLFEDMFIFCFWLFCFLRLFWLLKKKNPKTLKIFKKTKIFYFGSCFIFLEDYMNYNISLFDLEQTWYCGERQKICVAWQSSWAIFIFVWVCTSLCMYSWVN